MPPGVAYLCYSETHSEIRTEIQILTFTVTKYLFLTLPSHNNLIKSFGQGRVVLTVK